MRHPTHPQDQKNLYIAVALAALLVVVWQIFIEMPKRQERARWLALQQQKQQEMLVKQQAEAVRLAPAVEQPNLTREQRVALSPRLKISTPALHGSIALKGLRFDDLTLARYRNTIAPDSPEVTLFSPPGEKHAYFMQAGWSAADGRTRVPDENTVWNASADILSPGTPVTLSWDNGQGVIFYIDLSVDDNYMFTLRQRVENTKQGPIMVAPYALINRSFELLILPHEEGQRGYHAPGILHEGPIGIKQGKLEEISYEDVRENENNIPQGFEHWLGFTDKYWLAALIPDNANAQASFSYYQSRRQDRFQADYLGARQEIPAGGSVAQSMRFFAGAKELDVLDAYAAGETGAPRIPLFDRAVDLGILYFLTKPIFLTLNFFYDLTGNFGVAILLLTVLIKILMYPLAVKAYRSTSQLRELQPEIIKLREQHGKDPMKMQQEMLALYKRAKVNPAAGCLPLLVQLPVFFALYKVLFVTIEMRHAPFFGWIRDLSAPDPSNLFTLFGLIPWDPPGFFHLGILPILMCASMVIQMRQQPAPPDPMQAKIMKWMPYVFLIFFIGMPAGLLIYWTWSNIISIIQQAIISRRVHAQREAKLKAQR